MENKKILQVRSDILMHDLINENEMNTIEWIVMHILDCSHEDIKGKVKVLNIRLNRVDRKERSKYVDLVIEYQNEKIILELNNHFHGIYTRNILYAANRLLNNYSIDVDDYDYYKKVTRVILINLNWYDKGKGDLIEGKKEYILPFSDKESDGYLFKMINVNLDYYDKLCYDKLGTSDKFYKLVTIDNEDDLIEFTKNEKLLKSYNKKLIDLSNDEDYVEGIMDERIEENVLRQTEYFRGLHNGVDQGISQGISQTKKEMVINMYNKNYKLEDICDITNLNIEEIKKIINKQQ